MPPVNPETGTFLDRRRACATILKVQFKTGGCCHRCGFPYAIDPPHNLTVKDVIGFFFLCETCWHMTSQIERLDYLRAVWKHEWSKDGSAQKLPLEAYEEAIRTNVPAVKGDAV